MAFFGTEFIAGVVVGLVIGFIVRSRTTRQDLTGVPNSMAAQMPRSPQGTSPGSMPPSAAPQAAPAPGGTGLSPQVMLQIGAALAGGNKIEAIKLLREATGLDLKASKDAIERMDKR